MEHEDHAIAIATDAFRSTHRWNDRNGTAGAGN
jgi:hypothetical protein